MMRSLGPTTAACVIVFFLGACKSSDKESAPAPPASEAPAEVEAKPATPIAPASQRLEIPTEADFEEKAETEITEQNLEEALDALEKEITAED